MPDLNDLASKARQGDQAAEKALFDKLSVRFRYLAKRTVGEDDSTDIAQEAVMTVFQMYRAEQFTVSFEAWALGVLRMKVGNWLQKKKRWSGRKFSFDELTDTDTTRTVNPHLKRWLMECLKQVARSSGKFARVINLTYQGFTSTDICHKLDMSANHYYVTLSRGRSLLKQCLQEKGASL